jgi:MFS family permease
MATQHPTPSTTLFMPQSDPPGRRALWRNRDFTTFWAGETISLFGSQVTLLAVPLTAVLTLNASSEQLGLVRFLENAPYLVFPLLFGAWVDRRRRRPLMLLANATRALVIGIIPLLAFLHVLSLLPLALIACTTGIFTVLFDVCWLAFVPSIVSKTHLVEANSKLTISSAAAEVGGPGLAGILVQLLTAPLALLADSLSYVVSVASLLLIRQPEPAPQRQQNTRLFQEIGEGMRFAFSNIYLRIIMAEAAGWNFCFSLLETIFLIYTVRQLGFSPGLLGLVYAVGAIGGLLGATIASPLAQRVRLGFVLCGTFTLGSLPWILIPVTTGSQTFVAAVFIVVFFLVRTALGIWQVLTTSLRQTITPNHLLGRTTASLRTVSYGTATLGPLVAGALGAAIGLRASLWVAGLGFALTWAALFLSPLPQLRGLPAPEAEAPIAQADVPTL